MGVSITVYGGAGVIGGNKILLEADGTTMSSILASTTTCGLNTSRNI
jgi:hypothetical protein